MLIVNNLEEVPSRLITEGLALVGATMVTRGYLLFREQGLRLGRTSQHGPVVERERERRKTIHPQVRPSKCIQHFNTVVEQGFLPCNHNYTISL